MPQIIGLRVYKLYLTERRSKIALSDKELPFNPLSFVKDFVGRFSVVTQEQALERRWYFEPVAGPNGHVGGIVQYGTFGFSSKILDVKSRTKKYDRIETDVEQIPLFFNFWKPDGAKYMLVALQSFGARSCVDLIKGAFLFHLQDKFPDLYPRFKKLMPNDSSSGLFSTAPVKALTFLARHTPTDIASRLAPYTPEEPVDITLTIRAEKRRSLGGLSVVLGSVSRKEGFLEHEGVEFDQAFAEIRVKGKPRRIGVFGPMADTGAVDITEDVKFVDGHPTFASISQQAYVLLADFHSVLLGQ